MLDMALPGLLPLSLERADQSTNSAAAIARHIQTNPESCREVLKLIAQVEPGTRTVKLESEGYGTELVFEKYIKKGDAPPDYPWLYLKASLRKGDQLKVLGETSLVAHSSVPELTRISGFDSLADSKLSTNYEFQRFFTWFTNVFRLAALGTYSDSDPEFLGLTQEFTPPNIFNIAKQIISSAGLDCHQDPRRVMKGLHDGMQDMFDASFGPSQQPAQWLDGSGRLSFVDLHLYFQAPDNQLSLEQIEAMENLFVALTYSGGASQIEGGHHPLVGAMIPSGLKRGTGIVSCEFLAPNKKHSIRRMDLFTFNHAAVIRFIFDRSDEAGSWRRLMPAKPKKGRPKIKSK